MKNETPQLQIFPIDQLIVVFSNCPDETQDMSNRVTSSPQKNNKMTLSNLLWSAMLMVCPLRFFFSLGGLWASCPDFCTKEKREGKTCADIPKQAGCAVHPAVSKINSNSLSLASGSRAKSGRLV